MTRRLNTDVLQTTMIATGGKSNPARRRVAALAAVPIFMAALSAASLCLLHAGVLTIWPANGVFLAGLLRSRARYRAALFGFGTCAILAGALLTGLPARVCVEIALANVAEVVTAFMLRRTAAPAASLISFRTIIRFAALAGAAPALVFTALSAALHVPPANDPMLTNLAGIWLAHATGTVCMLPLCATRRTRWQNVSWRGVAKAAALLAAVCLVVFGQSAYPLLFAIPAPLLGLVFAGGLEAGLGGLLLVAALATVSAGAGSGPFGRIAGGAADRMLIMQVFLAICGAQIFTLAAALRRQQAAEMALRKARDEMQGLAHTDTLTGLPNRRAFDEALDREFRRSVRHGTTLALVLLDVDRFKLYNDCYGHQRGDECLRAIGRELAAGSRRATDLAARYGGEELALLLPDADENGAADVAERVRAAIEAMKIPHEDNIGCGGVVTASLGVAVSPMEFGILSKEDLVRVADMHLYEAKRLGRNRVISRHTRPQAPVPPALPFEAQRADIVDALHAASKGCRSKFLDLLAERAAHIAGTPIGLVSLIGRNNQVFVGRFGLDLDGTPRAASFCDHAIQGTGIMVVPDSVKDPRFSDNPLVKGDLHLRFYAGSPIKSTHAAHPLGALCVIDTTARDGLFKDQGKALDELAGIAARYIDRQLDARGA